MNAIPRFTFRENATQASVDKEPKTDSLEKLNYQPVAPNITNVVTESPIKAVPTDDNAFHNDQFTM